MNVLQSSEDRIYHLHFFFNVEEIEVVSQIHRDVASKLNHLVKVFPCLLRPAGPLPKPMFMLEFEGKVLYEIVSFFSQYQECFSILIHPEIQNEVLAHTLHAIWIGKEIPLRLAYLK